MADRNKNVDGMDIKTSAKKVDNKKSQKQKESLAKMKANAATEEAKAKAKRRESADKKKKASANNDATKKAAVAAGAALLSRVGKNKKGKKGSWIKTAVIAAVVIIALVVFWPQISTLLTAFTGSSGEQGILPDEVMGYNAIDFQDAILGEARQKQELVVMEQDIQVDSTISHALANIALLKKTKIIHSFGTGVYTVDMSAIDSEHIAVDEDARKVTVTIPHALLQYVNIDVNATTFEETEHVLFKIGDIKFTQEQQKVLDESIDEAMRDELNNETLFDQADEFARFKVQEIFQPLVSAVSEEFIVVVVTEG